VISFNTDRGRLVVVTATLALAVFFIWTWWLAKYSGSVDFLDRRAPAEWILYPKPPEGVLHKTADLDTAFRRGFVLSNRPGHAVLSIRAMKKWEISINGKPISASPATDGNWKHPVNLDVSEELHAGTNEVVVTSRNSNGPPALWLSLDAGGQRINSDIEWEASLVGAVWCKAQLASAPVEFQKGNLLNGGERPMSSLLNHLPTLLIFSAFSAALLFRSRRWLEHYAKRGEPWGPVGNSRRFAAAAVGVAAVFWAVLWLNNSHLIPYVMGFDSIDHLNYIDYIKTRWRLPLANEGWQMYQPPLYYLINAVLLAPFHRVGFSNGSIELIRVFGLLVGIVHFTLVFLSLRLLFPGRLGPQLFGLILAAFMPECIYLSYYPTNESLAAALATASLYFCLRIVREDRSRPWLFAAMGVCLGASLLTKFTGLLVGVVEAVVLLGRTIQRREYSPRPLAATIGLAFAAAFAVCGWHYIRVWRLLGNPLVGNWDAASGFHWWMERGYVTPAFFFRFGASLTNPWYSGFNGFADGLYSTMWGDGLWSGWVKFSDRPMWNYELMAAGFILALVPSVLIFTGALMALRRLVQKPDAECLLLVGVAAATLAALVLMNLKLPNAGQVKAFYGLIALLPICAFGASGWEFVEKRWKKTQGIVGVLFGVWALNSYCSLWVPGWDPQTFLQLGRTLARDGYIAEANQYYQAALRRDPRHVETRIAAATDLGAAGQIAPARQLIEAALKDAPDNANSHQLLSLLLLQQNQLDEAVTEARRVIALAPDNSLAPIILCTAFNKLGRLDDAMTAAREALRVNALNAETHYMVAQLFAQETNSAESFRHYRLAAQLKPDWPEAHEQTGLACLSLNQFEPARIYLEHACDLTQRKNASYLATLASAYGELGRFADAIATATRALELARAAGDQALTSRTEKQLESYKANQPYRQK
jgi:tetratricopeptide (TPR) repeat protein